MDATTITTAEEGRSVNDSLLATSWWVLVGAASGAVAGIVVGGIGGRLAMLLLRLTSPDSVVGLESDDGFEIGVFTTSTLNLLLVTAFMGGIVGVLYAAVRTAIPSRLRLALWTLLWTLVGGAGVVHDDGIDFNVLEPALLSIALFVALPALAAAAIVLLVERWSGTEPWADRRFSAGIVVAALLGTFVLVLAFAVMVVALVLERLGPVRAFVRTAARVVVPAAMLVFGVMAGVDLVADARSILD
jgi:hypothetical protein